MDIYRTWPKESGSLRIRGHEVAFYKCQEQNMGTTKYFWRADCKGETIATSCKTKAECIKEARLYLKKKSCKGHP